MQWNGYEVFDPGVDRPLSELPRREARAAYERLMSVRDDRIAQLRKLTGVNGINLDAEYGIQELNDWFVQEVEPSPEENGRLRNIWYSVVNDIGLLLGERAIAASGGKLSWSFSTKKDVSYQRHVVVGFDVPNPDYHADFDWVVATYAHRVVQGENVERAFFSKLLESALDKV